MSEEQESNMGKQAWQSQTLDAPPISIEFIHFQVTKLNSSWRREMQRVYWAVGAGVCVGLFAMFKQVPAEMVFVIRTGVALAVLGFVGTAVMVRQHDKRALTQPEQSFGRSLEAYRSELERRRDYYLQYTRSGFWLLMPSVLVLVCGGIAFDPRPGKLQHYGFMVALAVFGIAYSLLSARRRARSFQDEINALATLDRPQN
jgi:hypothetical protein